MPKNEEFKLHLSIGEENVTLALPVGPGLPNYASLTVGSHGTNQVLRCVPDDQDVASQETRENVRHSSPETLRMDSTTQELDETRVLREGEMAVVPVDLSEETEETIVPKSESLEEVFLTKYVYKAHLYKHMCNALGKHVEFSDLTKPNLVKIKDYLAERVSANTVSLYCSVIKACMNLYSDEGVFNCKGFAQVLKHKRTPSMNVYLSEEEIKKIEQYVPKTRCESEVKVKFLIECYTGARLSDVEKMSASDISGDSISYISKKTSVLTSIPIHKNLRQLLEAKSKKTTPRSVYCRTIKSICKSVGICEETSIFYHGKQKVCPKWKFVGSHTARRSFATNLALRNVPLNVISRMMGHTDTKMTEKYILANIESIDDRAMGFFQ